MRLKITNDVPGIVAGMNECGEKGIPFLFAFNYEMDEGIFIRNPLEQNEILFELNGVGNKPETTAANKKHKLEFTPISPEDYRTKFEIVQNGIHRGDSSLVNLTVRTPIRTGISLRDIFLSSHAPYQIYVPGRFVCFSPECFVKIEEGSVSTYPMKGTVDASLENAESILLNDPKEIEEHHAVVELLRNDIATAADEIHTERFRYIDRIKTNRKEILQTSSEICGRLPDDYQAHLGDIIYRMLPAGSISGAPKESTLRIIHEAENRPRGFYTGVFGYFDGRKLDSGVLIRFIEEEDGKQFFRSGGGITARSRCEKEYQEILDKIYLPA